MSHIRLARAAVFDLDGTLLDSLADIARAVNLTLEQLGYPTHSLEDFKGFIGEGVDILARKSLPKEVATDTAIVADVVEGYRRDYHRTWNQQTQPYPGIAELLDWLTSEQVPMAVLSNKPDGFTRLCVEQLLASWTFYPVFGERTGVPRKPDPAGALEIAQILQHPPSEIVYLGDTGVDMQTAKAAGMIAVGVTWGFRSADELRHAGAEFIIRTPNQLFDHVRIEPVIL